MSRIPETGYARRGLFAAILGTLPFMSATVFAAEWSLTPSVRLTYENNDNISLTLAPHENVQGAVISPRLDMGMRSERWGVAGSADITRTRYSDNQILDRDAESFTLTSSYRRERDDFALLLSRVNDTTLPDDVEDPDLGRTTVQESRRIESVQPSWNWLVSERSRLQLSYQFSDVSYTGGNEISLFDYQQRIPTATWSYLLSPRSTLFFTANLSRYRVPVISLESQIPATGAGSLPLVSRVDSESPSLRVGMSREISETMKGTIMLGRRKTTAERIIQDCIYNAGLIVVCTSPRSVEVRDSGTTFSGNLDKRFDNFSLAVSATRDITASGAGTEIEWDTLSLRVDRPITERFKASLAVNGTQSRRIVEVVSTTTDIKQYSIEPSLQWQWTRQADVGVSYRFLHLERENEDRAVHSRTIYLVFSYAWQPIAISR